MQTDYVFKNGRLVFSDGVSYSIAEACTVADPRLTEEDRQAIHLVKKIFDAEMMVSAGVINSFVNICTEVKSLDDMAEEFGDYTVLQ